MATTPGILTDWPWKPLGSFKYLILAPWVLHSSYTYLLNPTGEGNFTYFFPFLLILSRFVHYQIWVSIARYRTAKGRNRIVDRGIEFEQVDRESNWDDQILFNGLLLYAGYCGTYPRWRSLPVWNTTGMILSVLLHAGPVEFLYYWFHRAVHHHYLYNRYHSHHHSSIVTEPITSVTHPFAEHIVYYNLFAIPIVGTLMSGTASISSIFLYIFYVDFMNSLGHCNFELVSIFSVFPFLKFLIYSPSFHSLHHTKFRTNYALFMPMYDYIYNTVDESSDILWKRSLDRPEEVPDVVNLVHLMNLQSIYHLPVGFASFASKPFSSTWYLWGIWPFTLGTALMASATRTVFVSERMRFEGLKLQSWVVPRFKQQYSTDKKTDTINYMIEQAVENADAKGVKVLSFGLLNQGEKLNENGELYLRRIPKLKIKLVDGSSLAVAVILNSIPEETRQVLVRGSSSKVARRVADILSKKGIQVITLYNNEPKELALAMHEISIEIWLVGDGLTVAEQAIAPKGTKFIPYSQFPVKKLRRDCFYYNTPAMVVPKTFENLKTCENWLPRNVMSAWRIAGILHAMEGWNVHEVGDAMFDVQKVWQAGLQHGFRPLNSASMLV